MCCLQNPFKKKRKNIVNDISALFKPGTFTAIMGPSGSGKTTVLNVLSGRTRGGYMTGRRLIDGNDLELENYAVVMRKKSGYVKQNDIFFKDLTVGETLTYAARLCLPEDKVVSRVDQVLNEVGLTSAKNTKVGDRNTPGISGGQRRRLSTALELLKLPALLLLDEPTSGLDANSAHKFIQLLKSLATSGNRTIVTTIHSPRPDSFAIFDTVLLLGQNGTVVYFGPPSKAVDYFTEQGFGELKDNESPGDFIIDAVGLDPTEDNERSNSAARLEQTYKDSSIKQQLADDINSLPVQTDKLKELLSPPQYACSWLSEISVLFSRRYLRYVSRGSMFSQLFQVFCASLLLGVAFGGKGFIDRNIWYRPYKSIMYIVIIATYSMVIQYLDIVPMYFEERSILRKELEKFSIRMSTYMSALFLHEVPLATIQVLILTVIGYWLVDLNTELYNTVFFLLTLTLGAAAWQSVVCLCSFVTNKIGTVYTLCFLLLGLGSVFGGLLIVYSHILPIFIPFYWTSIPAITYRALLHNNLICCDMTFDCNDELEDTYGSANYAAAERVCAEQGQNTTVNLGGLSLFFLDLDSQSEVYDVVVLLFVLVACRILAVLIFKYKVGREYKIKSISNEMINELEMEGNINIVVN